MKKKKSFFQRFQADEDIENLGNESVNDIFGSDEQEEVSLDELEKSMEELQKQVQVYYLEHPEKRQDYPDKIFVKSMDELEEKITEHIPKKVVEDETVEKRVIDKEIKVEENPLDFSLMNAVENSQQLVNSVFQGDDVETLEEVNDKRVEQMPEVGDQNYGSNGNANREGYEFSERGKDYFEEFTIGGTQDHPGDVVISVTGSDLDGQEITNAQVHAELQLESPSQEMDDWNLERNIWENKVFFGDGETDHKVDMFKDMGPGKVDEESEEDASRSEKGKMHMEESDTQDILQSLLNRGAADFDSISEKHEAETFQKAHKTDQQSQEKQNEAVSFFNSETEAEQQGPIYNNRIFMTEQEGEEDSDPQNGRLAEDATLSGNQALSEDQEASGGGLEKQSLSGGDSLFSGKLTKREKGRQCVEERIRMDSIAESTKEDEGTEALYDALNMCSVQGDEQAEHETAFVTWGTEGETFETDIHITEGEDSETGVVEGDGAESFSAQEKQQSGVASEMEEDSEAVASKQAEDLEEAGCNEAEGKSADMKPENEAIESDTDEKAVHQNPESKTVSDANISSEQSRVMDAANKEAKDDGEYTGPGGISRQEIEQAIEAELNVQKSLEALYQEQKKAEQTAQFAEQLQMLLKSTGQSSDKEEEADSQKKEEPIAQSTETNDIEQAAKQSLAEVEKAEKKIEQFTSRLNKMEKNVDQAVVTEETDAKPLPPTEVDRQEGAPETTKKKEIPQGAPLSDPNVPPVEPNGPGKKVYRKEKKRIREQERKKKREEETAGEKSTPLPDEKAPIAEEKIPEDTKTSKKGRSHTKPEKNTQKEKGREAEKENTQLAAVAKAPEKKENRGFWKSLRGLIGKLFRKPDKKMMVVPPTLPEPDEIQVENRHEAVDIIEGLVEGGVRGECIILESRSVIKSDVIASERFYCKQKAMVFGNVSANVIVIEGTIRGNIQATQTVRIKDGGCVFGNVIAPAIVLDPKGYIAGDLIYEKK